MPLFCSTPVTKATYYISAAGGSAVWSLSSLHIYIRTVYLVIRQCVCEQSECVIVTFWSNSVWLPSQATLIICDSNTKKQQRILRNWATYYWTELMKDRDVIGRTQRCAQICVWKPERRFNTPLDSHQSWISRYLHKREWIQVKEKNKTKNEVWSLTE